MKKAFIIVIAVIGVILVSLIAFIKLYVTPERVKEFVIPAAEQSLNRKVDIGSIDIGLFRGIGLNDFAIREADQKSDFVKFKEFVLKFKLLPLLSKNLVIDELKLVSPEINVRRGKDGRFNFEDIGTKEEGNRVGKENGTGGEGGLPVSLLVQRVSVSDAQFTLSDLLNKLPDVQSSADIDISVKSIDGSDISTEGTVDIRIDKLVMKDPPRAPIKDLNAGLRYALSVNLKTLDIHIDRADLTVQKIPLSVKGDIKKIRSSPEVDVGLSLPKVKAGEIYRLAALFTDLKGLSLSGSMAADVHLAGELKKTEKLKAKGNVQLEQLGITSDKASAVLDGNISFDEKLMNIKLKSVINNNAAEIQGSVRNYMQDQDINLDVHAKEMNLEQVIPAGKPGTEPSEKSAGPSRTSPGREADPPDLKLTARGEVRIDSALYKGLTMSDFHAKYVFKDNRFELPELTAKAGQGTLNMSSSADLSRPGYRYRLSGSVHSLKADEIVNAFFPEARDTIFGTISFNIKMNGAGTLPASIKKNLIADGDFTITDGKITGAKVTKELAQFLNIKELETIRLNKAGGTISIKNSTARLDSLFSSDDLSMDPKGTIGLDETLDLAFNLKLSPRLTDRAMSSKIGTYIKDEEGWGTVPLIVSGTFADPVYAVDVAKAGKKAIEKEIDRYFDKLLDKKGEEKKKELEPMKDLLKGIFR